MKKIVIILVAFIVLGGQFVDFSKLKRHDTLASLIEKDKIKRSDI